MHKANNIILEIDTTKILIVTVRLVIGDQSVERTVTGEKTRAQQVLSLTDALLGEQGIKLTEITEIKVNPGPGSFTGIRVGVAVAQMLSNLLGIPINSLPPGSLPQVSY